MTLQRLLRIGLLILLPLAIIAAAVPRLFEGIALEQAFPERALLMANFNLPKASYIQLDRILAGAPVRDGEVQILRAEAALDAGRSSDSVLPLIEGGLAHAPADARGWILFASLLKDRKPQTAAKALSLAFALAPFDYYLIVPRTALGAQLWDYLPSPERRTILADAHAIALNPNRRDDLHAVLSTPAGAALVTRSLADDPEGIRRLNRDLAREALHLP